jgi:cell division inhibitor SulA
MTFDKILYILTVFKITTSLPSASIFMANPETISGLLTRQDTWRGRSQRRSRPVAPTGYSSLNLLLQGGWPTASVTELLPRQFGIGELSLLLPLLKDHSNNSRLCLWLDPPYQPYAPTLAAAGIALERLLVVRSKNPREWLWAAEQSIRSGALLLAWARQQAPRYTDLRKLQLAAADSSNAAFLFSSVSSLAAPSPVALRLELESLQVNKLLLTVRKMRGAAPGAQLQLPLTGPDTQTAQRTHLTQLQADRHYSYEGYSGHSPARLKS